MNIPNQRSLSSNTTFVGVPKVEIHGGCCSFNRFDGEIIGYATLVLTDGNKRTASHHQLICLSYTSVRNILAIQFHLSTTQHQVSVKLKEVGCVDRDLSFTANRQVTRTFYAAIHRYHGSALGNIELGIVVQCSRAIGRSR